MSHEKELYQKCGIKDCVGKPFRVRELWACLLKYISPVRWDTEDINETRQHDEELKYILMVNFVNDNKNRYNEITEAINSGDIKLANRLAHTMKSNAGQLGKTKLQKAAADVEYLLKDGKNLVTSEHLAILKTELNAVLDEIAPLLSEDTTPQAEVLGREEARELLVKLKPLLEKGNPDCLKFIDALRGIPGSGELIQQMENFDFELATETLDSLDK
jgi:HPt (histidine-containing phosphotransfer) domain-containing protein